MELNKEQPPGEPCRSGEPDRASDKLSRTLVWAALGLAVCLVLAGFVPVNLPPPAPPEQTGAETAARQEPFTVEARLAPRSYVELALPYGARAEEVRVVEGQQVAAGELLALLDGHQTLAAQAAAAELQVLLASQALDELQRTAGVVLGQAEVALALAEKQRDYAQDHLEGLLRPRDQRHIDQAYANLLLARERLMRAQEDLAKAQAKYANKKNFIWYFINQRQFKLTLTGLEAQLAYHQRRLLDAEQKFADLLEPVDPILLAQAQADADAAQADWKWATRQRDDLLTGPDPEDLALAQARLAAAQSSLEAAKVALRASEVRAPIAGEIVDLNIKPGEWLPPRSRLAPASHLVVVADLNDWLLETVDLPESQVALLQPGAAVTVTVDAYPGQEFSAHIESIAGYYTEDDGDIYYPVKLHLDTDYPGLRWGMRARVTFQPLLQP